MDRTENEEGDGNSGWRAPASNEAHDRKGRVGEGGDTSQNEVAGTEPASFTKISRSRTIINCFTC